MSLTVRPLSDVLGAEIIGLGPIDAVDAEAIADVRRAWLAHCLLLFRDLAMTPEQHVAFTAALGPLHIMGPAHLNLPGHPEVFRLSNMVRDGEPQGLPRAGWGWHSDGEDKQVPNAGSLLYALRVPPEGGDTQFANMYAALDALPADVRRRIEGRRGRFSRAEMHHVNYPHLPPLTEEDKRERPDVWHPLVRTHPESGRPSLYVGRWLVEIEGIPGDEGAALIDWLCDVAVRPEFVYRHRWRAHDALLWDNRCLQHCALPFDEDRWDRYMHRTTLEGDVPFHGAIRSEVVAA